MEIVARYRQRNDAHRNHDGLRCPQDRARLSSIQIARFKMRNENKSCAVRIGMKRRRRVVRLLKVLLSRDEARD